MTLISRNWGINMKTCIYCEYPLLSSDLSQCPRCGFSQSVPPPPKPKPTIVDSHLSGGRGGPPTKVLPTSILGPGLLSKEDENTHLPTRPETKVLRMRPGRRSPMAKICIVDDFSDDGQWIRIRVPTTVIGREEGDVLIPHDESISARHAELLRTEEDADVKWFLKDVSRYGTFVRVRVRAGAVDCRLRNQQEILLGCHWFRFEKSPRVGAPPATSDTPENETRARVITRDIRRISSEQGVSTGASLIEVLSDSQTGEVHPVGRDCWIGTGPRAQIQLKDPFLDPVHARIYRDDEGQWHLEDKGSLNGSWVRLKKEEKHEILSQDEFLMGEQRLIVKVLRDEGSF